MTARTPDEPYFMWRRVSASLPREIEAVRLAPCPATPSKSIRLSQTIIRHNAGTGTDARAAMSVGFRVGALVFGGLSITVDVWKPIAARLCPGLPLLRFEARQDGVFPCESYCVRVKCQVTLRLRSEGLTAAFHDF